MSDLSTDDKIAHQRINLRKKNKNSDNEINIDKSKQNTKIVNPLILFKYPTGITMNLMEEVLLCGMKDDEGHTSIWNDSISLSLRGAALIELALEGHIELDQSHSRIIPCGDRHIVIKNKGNVENHILSETLSIMKSAEESISLSDWLLYLTGETWNPFKLQLQIRRVRDRLSKTLSEKGVLAPRQQDFVLFNVTTYPLSNNQIKMSLLNRIRDILVYKWNEKLYLKDIRSYCLVVLTYTATVIDNVLYNLSNDDYNCASETILKISNLELSETIRNLTTQLHKSNIEENYIDGLNIKKIEFILSVLQVLCNQ